MFTSQPLQLVLQRLFRGLSCSQLCFRFRVLLFKGIQTVLNQVGLAGVPVGLQFGDDFFDLSEVGQLLNHRRGFGTAVGQGAAHFVLRYQHQLGTHTRLQVKQLLAEPRCVGLSCNAPTIVIELGGFGVTFNGVFNPAAFEGQHYLVTALRLPPSC